MSQSDVHHGYADGLSWEEAMSLIMRRHEDMYAEDEEGDETVVSSEDEEDTDKDSSSKESADETDEEDTNDRTGEESEEGSEGESEGESNMDERMHRHVESREPDARVSRNAYNGRYQSHISSGTDRQDRVPQAPQDGYRHQVSTVNTRGEGHTQSNVITPHNVNIQSRSDTLYEEVMPPTFRQTRPQFQNIGFPATTHGSSTARPAPGTQIWNRPVRKSQLIRNPNSVPSPRTGTIQQAFSPFSLALRRPQTQHHFSTPRIPLRQPPSHLDHDQALRTHEMRAGQRPKRSSTVEDSGRNKAKLVSMTSTNGQKMDQPPITGANFESQSLKNVRKTVPSLTPSMSRAQALSPWSQKPPWPPGYVLAESLKKPSPWAIYEQSPNSPDPERLPSDTLHTSTKRRSDTVEDEAESPSSKRPRTDTSRPSSDVQSIGPRDGGNANQYVGDRYRTPDGRPRRFSGELLSEKELRGHIAGYPPRDQPMPKGLSVEEKVRYWPNHLHGKLLLEITDGVWGLKPTEIARIFDGNRHEYLLKANTLVKRILKLRDARDAGKEIL